MLTIRKKENSLATLLILLFSLGAIVLIDTVIGNISDFQYDEKYAFLSFFLSSLSGEVFFSLLVGLFIIVQSLLLYQLNSYIQNDNKFYKTIYKIILILHFLLISLLLCILLSILFANNYYFGISKIGVGIGFTTASIMFFILFKKLFNWYIKVKNKVVLTFAIGFLLLGITKIIFELGIFIVHYDYNDYITAETVVEFPDYSVNSILSLFQDSYWIFAVISFTLVWMATVLLIQNYKNQIGHKKFFLLTILSLLVFVPTPIGIYFNESDIGNFIDPVIFYTFTTFNATIASILFLITFYTLIKNIDNKQLQRYLLLIGIGLFLYFVSDQANIEQHAYPPYGFISIIFTGYASYLIFLGLLSSAIVISKDSKLRKEIYHRLKEKFLYDASLGEMYEKNENQNQVVNSILSRKEYEISKMSAELNSDEVNEIFDQIYEILKNPSGTKDS
jgi:hypothetical protein